MRKFACARYKISKTICTKWKLWANTIFDNKNIFFYILKMYKANLYREWYEYWRICDIYTRTTFLQLMLSSNDSSNNDRRFKYIGIRRSWPKKQFCKLSFSFLPSIVPNVFAIRARRDTCKVQSRLMSTRGDRLEFAYPRKNHFNRGSGIPLLCKFRDNSVHFSFPHRTTRHSSSRPLPKL